MKFCLSTIAPDAAQTAKEYGLGLEIAEYCTAWNMDAHFPETDAQVRQEIQGVSRRIFHGPFNELFPCAIDPKAQELAAQRYRQAISLAKAYGAEKIVIHGGYNPYLYYQNWYVQESISFWKGFLREDPGITVVLENVLEETPEPLLEIVQEVGTDRLGLCLDVGHVNAYSKVPVSQWLTTWGSQIRHLHIHNNFGDQDSHNPLFTGNLPIAALLRQAAGLCPEATLTLEVMEAAPSVKWLQETLEENLWI